MSAAGQQGAEWGSGSRQAQREGSAGQGAIPGGRVGCSRGFAGCTGGPVRALWRPGASTGLLGTASTALAQRRLWAWAVLGQAKHRMCCCSHAADTVHVRRWHGLKRSFAPCSTSSSSQGSTGQGSLPLTSRRICRGTRQMQIHQQSSSNSSSSSVQGWPGNPGAAQARAPHRVAGPPLLSGGQTQLRHACRQSCR